MGDISEFKHPGYVLSSLLYTSLSAFSNCYLSLFNSNLTCYSLLKELPLSLSSPYYVLEEEASARWKIRFPSLCSDVGFLLPTTLLIHHHSHVKSAVDDNMVLMRFK